MAEATLTTIQSIGKTVTDDSIRALDLRSREAIEALTTTTAREVASFLYDRDADILQAATLEPSEAVFVMLDDQHGIPHVAQVAQGLQQAVIVALVQANGRLIKDIHHAGQTGTDLRSRFAASNPALP